MFLCNLFSVLVNAILPYSISLVELFWYSLVLTLISASLCTSFTVSINCAFNIPMLRPILPFQFPNCFFLFLTLSVYGPLLHLFNKKMKYSFNLTMIWSSAVNVFYSLIFSYCSLYSNMFLNVFITASKHF